MCIRLLIKHREVIGKAHSSAGPFFGIGYLTLLRSRQKPSCGLQTDRDCLELKASAGIERPVRAADSGRARRRGQRTNPELGPAGTVQTEEMLKSGKRATNSGGFQKRSLFAAREHEQLAYEESRRPRDQYCIQVAGARQNACAWHALP